MQIKNKESKLYNKLNIIKLKITMIGDQRSVELLLTIDFQIYNLVNLQLMLVMEKHSLTFSSINWLKLSNSFLVQFQILLLIYVFGPFLLLMVNSPLCSLKIQWFQVLKHTQLSESSLEYGLDTSYGHLSLFQCLWAWMS